MIPFPGFYFLLSTVSSELLPARVPLDVLPFFPEPGVIPKPPAPPHSSDGHCPSPSGRHNPDGG